MFQPVSYWIGLLSIVFLFTVGMTYFIASFAEELGFIDIPNERSAHTRPVPRGGGLSFVCGFAVFLIALIFSHFLSIREGLLFLLPGIIIAVLGLFDDWKTLSARVRLFWHFFAASLGLLLLGGMPSLDFGFFTLSASWILNGIALFYLVWFLNLYNFMDGIDGLAALEGISIVFGMAVIAYLHHQLTFIPIGLGFTIIAFLIWNFPPARLFMGDVGSGFLGIVLGLMSIYYTSLNASFFWSFLILSSVFFLDATITLIHRFFRKEPLFKAHSTHAYQHAARKHGSHFTVTMMIFLLNLLWAWPLAIWASFADSYAILVVFLSWIPLLGVALFYGAGKPSLKK